jgi:hypothetical protein
MTAARQAKSTLFTMRLNSNGVRWAQRPPGNQCQLMKMLLRQQRQGRRQLALPLLRLASAGAAQARQDSAKGSGRSSG